MLRRNAKLLAGLVIAAALAATAAQAQLILGPGDPAPSILAWDLENKTVVVEWQGVTIVNFWATWCVPCRTEMPVLQELYEEYGEAGLRIYGLLRERALYDDVVQFIAETGVEYPLLMLRPKQVKEWRDVTLYPTTFLIDGEGQVLRRYPGSSIAQLKQLRRDVQSALNGEPLEPFIIPQGEDADEEGAETAD